MVAGLDQSLSNIATVLFFLRGAEQEGCCFETYSAREAFDAFCRLHGLDPAAIRKDIDKEFGHAP